jgi:hypothetical protein
MFYVATIVLFDKSLSSFNVCPTNHFPIPLKTLTSNNPKINNFATNHLILAANIGFNSFKKGKFLLKLNKK